MEKEIAQYYGPLFLYVRKRVNNTLDAEDLTQEVFYKFSKSWNTEVQNAKSWLYTIAKNTITDYYRTNKKAAQDLAKVIVEDAKEDKSAFEELSTCILPFVEKLPEEYRTIVKLSELEDVPQKKIAEQLDMNYVTVRSKVQRGRKKLKTLIADCCQITQCRQGGIIDYQSKKNCC